MLKIRLRRMGKRHQPFFRVVVSDSRRTPIASAVEELGYYNPRPTPPDLKLDVERLRYWQDNGALLSPTVKKLVHRIERGELEAVLPSADDTGEAKAASEEKAASEKKAASDKKAEKAEKKAAAKEDEQEKQETKAAAKKDDAGDEPEAEKAEAAEKAEGSDEGEEE